MATLITKHLDTASPAGGTGDADTTSGADRAFSSLQEFRTWLNTNHPNFTTSDVTVDLYFKASTGVADAAPLDVAGVNFNMAGMDTDHKLRLIAADGHAASPLWSTSKYRLVQSNGFYSAMSISGLYVEVHGMQIENTGAKGGESKCVSVQSVNGQRVIFEKCFGRCTGSGTATGNGNVFYVLNVTTAQIYWVNCIAAGGSKGFTRTYPSSGSVTVAYNCLAYGNLYGFYFTRDSGTNIRLINCISYNNSNTDYTFTESGGTLTVTDSLSEDASSPDVNHISKTLTFTNAAGYDFHLVAGDTNAIGLGTGLSADATYPFSDDMDGVARGATWDIGPDQYVAAGPTYVDLNDVVIGAVSSSGGTGSLPLIGGGLVR